MNKMSEDIHCCHICDRTYKTNKSLLSHYLTPLHQRKLNNKMLLLNADDLHVYDLNLHNNKGEVIYKTKVDKDVYKHILLNNYSVWFTQKYVYIRHNNKVERLHLYIYYDFHHYIKDPNKPVVDHQNKDPLDNTLINLRPATFNQNARNRKKCKNASSRYHGVSYHKGNQEWRVNFEINGKCTCFPYDNETHAAYHYDLLVKENNLEEWSSMNNIDKPEDFVRKYFIKKDGLPKGIGRNGKKYFYRFNHKIVYGGYDTVEQAVTARNLKITEHEKERMKKILNEPILRNQNGVAIIKLNKNKGVMIILVDDEDYHKIKFFTLSINNGYIHVHIGNRKRVYLHRFLLNCNNHNEIVDHKYRNKLDYRKSSLRIITASNNAQNKSKTENASSQCFGVSYHKNTKQWRAYIKPPNQKIIDIGIFNTELEAAKARDVKAHELNKKGCCFPLNFE